MIYFIGDTHFGHKRIIELCNRPFDTVDKMNETLITNWNNVINKHDTVFMLGDFALLGKDKLIEIGNRLNGKKTLIIGNHDSASRDTYYKAGFEYISKYPIVLNEDYILSHRPFQQHGRCVNIFAHIHNKISYKYDKSFGFCASVELINYRPISLSEIETIIEQNSNGLLF